MMIIIIIIIIIITCGTTYINDDSNKIFFRTEIGTSRKLKPYH